MTPTPPSSSQTPIAEDPELTVQEMRWLMEIGIIAPQCNDTKTALLVFQALALCRPHADFPYIGLAFTYIGLRKIQEAITLLEETLLQHPNSAEVKSMLAMALKLDARNSEADRLLAEITATAENSTAPAYAFAEALSRPNAVQPMKFRR